MLFTRFDRVPLCSSENIPSACSAVYDDDDECFDRNVHKKKKILKIPIVVENVFGTLFQ